MAYHFFPATRAAAVQITELFDFVWPTAAALWNLRWQVAGFLNEVPTATPKQLNDRFVFGSHIHGANLRRASVEISWENQQSRLASIILANAFSVYEHWADEILLSVGMGADRGRLLQFDEGPSGKPGLRSTIGNLCASESAMLKTAYYPIFCKSSKYSWPIISNLLLCYRYFKELRNSQIHNGGKASDKAAEAAREFAPVSTKAALGMKGELIHHPIVKGSDIVLSLRGVVGFCDILLRMMITVDAELSRSLSAEAVLETAIKATKLDTTFSSNPQRRHMQVIRCCKSVGLPKPANVEAMRQFIVKRRLMTI
jgi:hypothetical protein